MPDSSWLEITTAIGCPNTCACCPQDVLLAAYRGPRLMTLESFVMILDKIPNGLRIDFSGFSEPFANPSCRKMILSADKRGHPIAVYTTLVGATPGDVDAIAGIPFVEFKIHVQDRNGVCRFATGEDYRLVLARALDVIPCAGLISVGGPPDPQLCIGQDYVTYPTQSRSANVYPVQEKAGRVRCERPAYRQNVVLPNLDVFLCCMDYGLEARIGSLATQRWDQLDRRGYDICRRCERSTVDNTPLPGTPPAVAKGQKP